MQLGISLTCQTLTAEGKSLVKFPPNTPVAFQNTSQFMFKRTSLGTLLLSMQHKILMANLTRLFLRESLTCELFHLHLPLLQDSRLLLLLIQGLQ